jgi:hypothetical protein
MRHQGSVLPVVEEGGYLLKAQRDYHSMPELKPRKTPSQKEEERQKLREDIEAYEKAQLEKSIPSGEKQHEQK